MREPNEFILADMIEMRAGTNPDLDVLTFEHLSLDGGRTPDEVRTYRQLNDNAKRIANYLRTKGMRKGDRFAIMLRNHPEFVEAMIAASFTGTVFVPVDPRTRGDKLAFMVSNSTCRGIFCADYNLAEVSRLRSRFPGVEWLLALRSDEAGVPRIADFGGVDALDAILSCPVPAIEPEDVALSDPVQIMYTSGTTGDPKGIMCSNGRFGGAGLSGEIFGYREGDRPYTGLSLTHTNAQGSTLMPSLYQGYRGVFSRKFTKSRLWDVCRHHGCTVFSMLGGIATAIYSEPARPDDGDNPVRMVVSAGTPIGIWDAFQKRFQLQVFELYAASDGGGMAFNPPGVGPIGSFGKALAGYEVKILDEEGNECPPGAVGEICCRSAPGSQASIEVEYFGDPEASRNKVHKGWNHSGDMGHSDAEGWLYFDFRKGGGIRHNGDFINPGFVEKVIAEDHQVDDVFVYGVPAASGAPGERDVVAALVPVNKADFDPAGIFRTCRAGLESNFVPTYLQVVDEIPKTASEKPQERFLIECFHSDAANVFREA